MTHITLEVQDKNQIKMGNADHLLCLKYYRYTIFAISAIGLSLSS